MCACLFRGAHVYRCMYTCVNIHADVRCLAPWLSTLFSQQNLSLKPELTDFANPSSLPILVTLFCLLSVWTTNGQFLCRLSLAY